VKSFIEDEDNLIDLNSSSPNFLFDVIDKVLEKFTWKDIRWKIISTSDGEPDFKRYTDLKKYVNRYLKRAKSPSKDKSSCENVSCVTFDDEQDEPQSSPAVTVTQDSPPHDENPI
jgi:hypothetical protein